MRPRDRELAARLELQLESFHKNSRRLPGIRKKSARTAFIEHLLESIHRIQYVARIASRPLSNERANPLSELFDPLKAAILMHRRGKIEEAFWMLFLFVHFGKNPRGGWRYAREIYGRLGQGGLWEWRRVSADPRGFRRWMKQHLAELRRPGGGFGNHRKYESLDPESPRGTGSAVESYVEWVNGSGTHELLMEHAIREAGGDPKSAFEILYRSMKQVVRFGRTAKFDYLAMVGKLKLANINPASTYLRDGATGPLAGAKLLFGGASEDARTLENWLTELDGELGVGMQVLEDALCNWQKSPEKFKPFRG
jgi:Alpha-glutamyl/putrescinyl thymine pyrophosphorylase clade 3